MFVVTAWLGFVAQGWQQRHCRIVGQVFSFAAGKDDKPSMEVNLAGAQLVEANNRNIGNHFEVCRHGTGEDGEDRSGGKGRIY